MYSNIIKQYFKTTFTNTNKYFINFINYLNNIDNVTKLHRWCNNTSPIYKYTCDWEKKNDNANRDNCYTNIK